MKKTSLYLLLLLSSLFLLLPEQGKALSLNFNEHHSGLSEITYQKTQRNIPPRKKVKKKRRTILDHKHKMGKGKNCPSF